MPLPTVQLSGLCKRFGAVEAVADVSFDVYPGEIFGLLGPNGAGKTTTIRMMLDIFRPDCGEVRLFGKKLDEATKNRIGYMPEERGLYRDLKLEPTLVYLATLKGMSESAARVAVGRLAEAARSVRAPAEEDPGPEPRHAAKGTAHRHAAARARPDRGRRAVRQPRPGQHAAGASKSWRSSARRARPSSCPPT